MNNNFKDIKEIINNCKNIVLTTHLNPDGDAIGSEAAMYDYLKQKGKNVTIINHSETPDHLQFLDPYNNIKRYLNDEKANSEIINSADLIIFLDANEYSRTKSMEEAIRQSRAKKICIDHHLGINPKNFDAYISDPEYPATSQILYDFIAGDGCDYLNKTVSEGLYAGIMTDTGSFRYPRTDKKTFLIAADLVSRGADPVEIYEKIYCNIPQEKIKLLARFINSITYHFNGKAAAGIVTQQDFRDFHSDVKDVEGFTGFLMSMKGIKSGFLFVELKDSIKLSLRSKGNIKMNEFAKIFGGGGHKNAAGATLPHGDIDDAKEKVLDEFQNFCKKHKH